MKNVLLILSAITLFSNCAPRIPFTQEVREHEKLTEEEMRKIQFYVSHDIVLQRGEKAEKGKEIAEGKLTTIDEKSLEQVIIKAGTPGIIDKVFDNNRIAIRFEEGEGKYLVFGDPSKQGRYTLLAGEWDSSNKGKLQYGGQAYITNIGAANIYLTFRMKNLYQFKKKQQVVKGIRL